MSKEIAEIDPDAARAEVLATIYDSRSQKSLFEDEQIAAVKTFDDAITLLGDAGIDEIEDFNDYGPGLVVVDKETLVDVPMMLVEWRFNNNGKFGDFVSVFAVTQDGRKVIFNDGSTGVREQLEKVTASRMRKGHPHPRQGLKVLGGLRRSDYTVNLPNPKKPGEFIESDATTFYLGNG